MTYSNKKGSEWIVVFVEHVSFLHDANRLFYRTSHGYNVSQHGMVLAYNHFLSAHAHATTATETKPRAFSRKDVLQTVMRLSQEQKLSEGRACSADYDMSNTRVECIGAPLW